MVELRVAGFRGPPRTAPPAADALINALTSVIEHVTPELQLRYPVIIGLHKPGAPSYQERCRGFAGGDVSAS